MRCGVFQPIPAQRRHFLHAQLRWRCKNYCKSRVTLLRFALKTLRYCLGGLLMSSACGLSVARALVLCVALFVVAVSAPAQETVDYTQLFDKKVVMIAAQDGVKLHTEIY